MNIKNGFLLFLVASSVVSCSANSSNPSREEVQPVQTKDANQERDFFVHVSGNGFVRDGKPYRYVGNNFWFGMNLGKRGDFLANARLARELDRLQNLGITNLRILAVSEGPDTAPYRISPAMQSSPGVLNDDYLEGLDRLLKLMGERNMTAVVLLNNFWHWSGGMAQYLNWFGAGAIPYPPPAAGGTWDRFQVYASKFYANDAANAAFRDVVRLIVTRTNSLTGKKYVDDPAIMAWELANEPRGIFYATAMNKWIDETAKFIKSFDRNHLVTTGSEGVPYSTIGNDYIKNHSSQYIDYGTIHIWAENWGWYDPKRADETYDDSVRRMQKYFSDHLAKTKQLGKPMVLEEFGFPRDGGSLDPKSSTTYKDRYYEEVFKVVVDSMRRGDPVGGVNFWAWAGEGRAVLGQTYWKFGDELIGDPPHEPQGWYSVFDTDLSTQAVIKTAVQNVTAIP